MNKKVLIGVLIGVLVVGIAGVGYAAFRVSEQGNEQERRAQVIAQSRAVDAKLEEIFERLADCDTSWSTSSDDPDIDTTVMLADANDDIRAIRKLLTEVETEIGSIPSDSVQAQYEATCIELDEVLSQGTDDAGKAVAACEAYKLVNAAFNDDKAGAAALNDAITLCNKEKYSEAKKKAAAAEKSFRALKTKLVNANKAYECNQISLAFKYADETIKIAKMQHELAVLGSKGSVNGYNSQISKLEKQRSVVADAAIDFDVASTTMESLVDGLYGNYVTQAKEAKNYWDEAKELVAGGTF